MKTVSIQIGKPKTVLYQGKSITTGIFKNPVSGPIFLSKLNLVGDGQADLKVHGGLDKALYAYGLDAYQEWKKSRPSDKLENGSFGENLCFESLSETSIYIGDTFKLGQSIIQAAQPRYPCFKLAVKFNDSQILKQFMSMGRSGVYFRVLKEGMIDIGDELILEDREQKLLSIAEMFSYATHPEKESVRIHELLKIKSLPSNIREKIESWL